MSIASRLRTAAVATALLATAAPALHADTPDARHLARPSASAGQAARGTSTCPPVIKTGTYRVEIKREGAEPTFALLVLERTGGCQSALLVTDEGASAVDIRDASAASLTGALRAGRQSAMIELHFTDAGVVGAMAQRSRTWSVSGVRTS